MADKTSSQSNQDFAFKVSFDGKPEKETKLAAYALDGQGNLLASSPVSEGQAKLSLPPAQARHARIFFAPSEAEGAGKATLESLERSRAYEAVWRFDSRSTVYEIPSIPEPHWKYWL